MMIYITLILCIDVKVIKHIFSYQIKKLFFMIKRVVLKIIL